MTSNRHRPWSLPLLLAALAIAGPALAEDPNVDSLVSELKGGQLGLSSLKLSGFADFTYDKYFFDKKMFTAWGIPKHGSFAVGNLNLFLDGQLSQRARSLIEVRFTYLPNGAQSATPDATGTFPRQSTSSPDPADNSRSVHWGGVIIERAWVEYGFGDRFTLRAGQFLTPYGVWNVDHGSPAIVGVRRPYIVGDELFPAKQVGLEAYGTFHAGSTLLGYHLTLSNGRIGDTPQYLDLDDRFGYGGRLFLQSSALGELRAGVSVYTGRYTNARNTTTPAGTTERIMQRYDETSLGADVRWKLKKTLVIAEAIYQGRRYGPGAPSHLDGSRVSSDNRWGGYVLLGYELPYRAMPFAMAQFYRMNDDPKHKPLPDVMAWSLGVNERLQPNLVLKLEYQNYKFINTEVAALKYTVRSVSAQASWAF
jgi:hypothetical protein